MNGFPNTCNCLQWMGIYPVDSAIQRLSNWGLIVTDGEQSADTEVKMSLAAPAPANVIPILFSLHLHSLSSFSSLPNISTYTEREPFFDFETNSSLFSADVHPLKSTV